MDSDFKCFVSLMACALLFLAFMVSLAVIEKKFERDHEHRMSQLKCTPIQTESEAD